MTEEGSEADCLKTHLQAEIEAREVIDVAKHAADRVFELVRMHAMTAPTVSSAIGIGLLVARQVYAETIQFAMNSMDGDQEDADAIRAGAQRLFRELLEGVDTVDGAPPPA